MTTNHFLGGVCTLEKNKKQTNKQKNYKKNHKKKTKTKNKKKKKKKKEKLGGWEWELRTPEWRVV